MKLNTPLSHTNPNAMSPAGTRPVHGGDRGDLQEVADSIIQAVGNYSRKNPAVVSVAIFAVGCYVGWKVKPW